MKILVALLVSSLCQLALAQSDSPRVGEISPEQQKEVSTRVESLNSTSFSFGPSWAQDTNNSNMYYSFHLGRNFEANKNAEIRLNLDAAFAGEGRGNWWSGSIGAGWLVLTSDISPVIGAELGYGYTHIKDADDARGFMVGGFAGVRFFRTSTAQMSLEGFVQSIMDGSDPLLSGLRLGVLF